MLRLHVISIRDQAGPGPIARGERAGLDCRANPGRAQSEAKGWCAVQPDWGGASGRGLWAGRGRVQGPRREQDWVQARRDRAASRCGQGPRAHSLGGAWGGRVGEAGVASRRVEVGRDRGRQRAVCVVGLGSDPQNLERWPGLVGAMPRAKQRGGEQGSGASELGAVAASKATAAASWARWWQAGQRRQRVGRGGGEQGAAASVSQVWRRWAGHDDGKLGTAAVATAHRRAAVAAAVGLFPQSSGSGHSRGRSLLSFSNDS